MRMNFLFCYSETEPDFCAERLPKEESCNEKVSFMVWIVENIKQTYSLRKKRRKKEEGLQKEHVNMGKELTLGEWLLKSPITEKDIGGCKGEHCGFEDQSGSDFPSVARERTYFSGCEKFSLSLEQLLNGFDYTTSSADYRISSEKVWTDENVDVKEIGFSSITRSQSGKVKKRVSFRQPEVSETIILYPSEVDYQSEY